jgi:pyruvate kinase
MALVVDTEVARRLSVAWGVHAVLTQNAQGMTDAVARATKLAREEGFAKSGDSIVVLGGIPFGHLGTTNALRVATLK